MSESAFEKALNVRFGSSLDPKPPIGLHSTPDPKPTLGLQPAIDPRRRIGTAGNGAIAREKFHFELGSDGRLLSLSLERRLCYNNVTEECG